MEQFPFPDYVAEANVEGMAELARVVTETAPPPARLLDIGSGPMDVTAMFANLGYTCSATDDLGDPWHDVGDTRTRIERFAQDVSIEFHRQVSPDYSITFETVFDVVLLCAVIEHLHESPRNLLNAALGATREGGVVVVTMPNSVNLRKRFSVLIGRTNYPPVDGFFHSAGTWRGHVREYTLDETRYILEQVGANVLVATTYHSLTRRAPRGLRTLFRLASVWAPTFRDTLLVVARKPHDWRPAEYDEDEFRRSIAKSVPQGVFR